MKKNRLQITVTENRYDIYGAPTFRNRIQAALLKSVGGVNESVVPGDYECWVRRDGFHLTMELHPVVV